MCAKHYENPTMLFRVTAENVGDVFLRHTVDLTTEPTNQYYRVKFYQNLTSVFSNYGNFLAQVDIRSVERGIP